MKPATFTKVQRLILDKIMASREAVEAEDFLGPERKLPWKKNCFGGWEQFLAALAKLEQDGWISCNTEYDNGGPVRDWYTLTPVARRCFKLEKEYKDVLAENIYLVARYVRKDDFNVV